MNKVALVGAFDRYNYGDLLFPLVIEKTLNKEDISCEFVGLVKNDLTHKGGVKSISYKDFFDNNQVNYVSAIILVGGEMLGASWSEMYNCLEKQRYPMILLRLLRKLNLHNIANKLAKKEIVDLDMKHPWVINQELFNKKVVYNSVGGSSIKLLPQNIKKYINKNLDLASYLSVRDKETKRQLVDIGLAEEKIQVSPDCAIVMSELFATELENTSIPMELVEGRYLVFQINYHLAKKNIELYAKALDRIAIKHNITIVLLPIGTADTHNDDIALKEISAKMNSDFYYVDNQNVITTMKLISMSALYIGTSLHGAITALSFNIPHVGLTKDVKKLEVFFDTWGLPNYSKCLEIGEIEEKFEELLTVNIEDYNKHTSELKKRANTSLEGILETITS